MLSISSNTLVISCHPSDPIILLKVFLLPLEIYSLVYAVVSTFIVPRGLGNKQKINKKLQHVVCCLPADVWFKCSKTPAGQQDCRTGLDLRAVTFPLKLRGSHLCWACHTPDMKVRHGDHSLQSSQHILLLWQCMYVHRRGMFFSLNVFMSAINVMCMSEDGSDQVTDSPDDRRKYKVKS